MNENETFLSNIKGLYEKLHLDGFLGEDLLDLIKMLSAIRGNTKFKEEFFPMIQSTIQEFYTAVMAMKQESWLPII